MPINRRTILSICSLSLIIILFFPLYIKKLYDVFWTFIFDSRERSLIFSKFRERSFPFRSYLSTVWELTLKIYLPIFLESFAECKEKRNGHLDDETLLHQAADAKHKARIVRQWLLFNLNPIGMVWSRLELQIRKQPVTTGRKKVLLEAKTKWERNSTDINCKKEELKSWSKQCQRDW